MSRCVHVAWLSLGMMAAIAAAQVGTTGTPATNTIPVFTGTSPATIGNSPIAVSGSNVGIGTPSPNAKLQVVGTASIGQGTGGGAAAIDASNTWAYYGNGSATNGIAISQWGQVGIGRNATEMFSVWLNASATTYEELVQYAIPNNSSGAFSSMKIGQVSTNKLFIDTADQNNNKGATLIQPWGGSVGIGTSNPLYALDVVGAIHASGGVTFPDGSTQTTAFNPTVCGGDYAESVDVTGERTQYEPGDVIVIDPSAPGKFLKANQAYSSLVAGVYSTKPGTVGRRQTTPKNPDEIPMAMVGIVPTKVSAENGPIKTGDLLVASSTPGRAMKGTDRNQLPGAVIGKALGPLDSGTGVIEVLITLQ
jgi:hypothetical protein